MQVDSLTGGRLYVYLEPWLKGVLSNTSGGLCSGRSVVRLSRLLWEQEVAGSNPAAPTKSSNFYAGIGDLYENEITRRGGA